MIALPCEKEMFCEGECSFADAEEIQITCQDCPVEQFLYWIERKRKQGVENNG